MKKVIILIGNYGSGKTEIALNMAFLAAAEGKRVQVVDLDRINSMNSVLGVVPRGTSGCDVVFAPSVVDEVYHDFSVASGPLPAIMEDKGGSEGRARMSVTLTPKARATVASSASHEDEDTQALARLLDTL